MSKADLTEIRAEIDALDAKWREGLRARAALVARVAANKSSDNNDALPIRPAREAAQLADIVAWQQENPSGSLAAAVAIWRELIGASLAQQGVVKIFAEQDLLLAARDYFGSAIAIETLAGDKIGDKIDKNFIAVVSPANCPPPLDGAAVFARLPLLADAATAFCYGAVPFAPSGADVTLARLPKSQKGGGVIVASTKDFIFAELDGALTAAAVKENFTGEWLGVYPRPPSVEL